MKFKRRQESKTDYKARKILLKSNKPRLIFRKTNRYIIGQYIKSQAALDFAVVGVNSKELLDFGWLKNAQGSLKSIPASYLTGFLIGKKIQDKGEEEAILDIGLIRNVHGSRVYAFLKGAIDSGLKIKADEKILPAESRILGKHMSKEINVNEIKSKIEKKFV